MVVEIIVIAVAALCGQAIWMFGPRLLDDKKKLADLQGELDIQNAKMSILESDIRDLKDRVNKQQLRGIMK